jgi:hypothetical protein
MNTARGRIMVSIGVLLLLIAIVFGTVATMRFGKNESSIVSAANAAPAAGVLHVLATQVTTVGSHAGSSNFEAWLDNENRRYRITWRDTDGALSNDMAIQDNQKLIYIPSLNHLDRESYDRSDTIGLQEARLYIWRYKELIKLGIAKPLGDAEIDRKPAPKVFVPARPGDDQEVEAILDAGTLAPLVETIYQRTSTGGREVARSIKTTYTTWEVIPTTNVPPNLFQLVSPGSVTVTSYTNLSSESAAKITGRAIYYVGPTFRQLPIYSIEIVQTVVKSPISPAVDRVYIVYAPVRNFWQLPAPEEMRYIASERLPSAEELAAVRRKLEPGVVKADGRSFKVELVLDNTLVTIGARSEEEVKSMTNLLRRLNP